MPIHWLGWSPLPAVTQQGLCAVWGRNKKVSLFWIENKRIRELVVGRDHQVSASGPAIAGAPRTEHPVAASTLSNVFARDAFGRIVMLASPAWIEVPGGGVTPDAPNALRLFNHTVLFVRGMDDDVWFNLRNGDLEGGAGEQDWSGWNPIPGGGRTRRAVTSMFDANGKIHVFAVGLDDTAYGTTGRLIDEGGRPTIDWSGAWFEVPSPLMHLPMSAASRIPAESFDALGHPQYPHANDGYLVATNPEGKLIYKVFAFRDPRIVHPGPEPRIVHPPQPRIVHPPRPRQVHPPGAWVEWKEIPAEFALGDFITDAAPAAVLTYRDFVPGDFTIVTPFDMLCVFAKLAADGSVWMNRATILP